ncbi:MAG TPA: GNAT family N-acetyltransferase [Syntrophorhabdaceae bacterium]|nr:GNAT family N-acetyltransferase [Syntrophorhabdaceae bacterium]
MAIEYRFTKDVDRKKLQDLFLSNKWDSGNYPDKLETALKGSHRVVTAWDGDRLVGLMNALADGIMNVFFLYLIVHPDYQKKGIGKELVQTMLHEYKDYARKMVIAYDEAMEFFQKSGFEVGENNVPMFVTYLTNY